MERVYDGKGQKDRQQKDTDPELSSATAWRQAGLGAHVIGCRADGRCVQSIVPADSSIGTSRPTIAPALS